MKSSMHRTASDRRFVGNFVVIADNISSGVAGPKCSF